MGLFSWLRGRGPNTANYPPAPDGLVIYAVGDLHGRDDLLNRVHDSIDSDRSTRPGSEKVEIYLGDYIDRGRDSAAVIERLIDRAKRSRCVFLRGNHEAILESFLSGRTTIGDWRPLGGIETLLSYGVGADLLASGADLLVREFAERLPPSHGAFFDSLKNSCELGAYFFVHAGVRPGIPLSRQAPDDLLWIRNEFLNCSSRFERIIVHGHTPVPEPEFLPNRINIDTGAYATNRLTCMKIDDQGAAVLLQKPAT